MKLCRFLCQRAAQKIAQHVDHYSQFHPQPVSMKTLVEFGSLTGSEASSYKFLRKELPVRLANIMKEIEMLPESLLHMPSIAMVRSWYTQSFTEMMKFEDVEVEDSEVLYRFAETLTKVRNRHANVVETMAQGVMEMIDAYGRSQPSESNIQYFLDRFYTNRISIRMLINQHVVLYGKEIANHPRHIGGIDPTCDVVEVVRDAYENARFLCEQYYLNAPELDLEICNPFEATKDIRLVYIPSHLYHMLFELLKNSMRASVECHMDNADIPPIKVRVCKGKEDLTIKVSDQGGGMPYNAVDDAFQYMYTTAPQPMPSDCRDGQAPLAGYGYGLPLSRLYARYFQGDLVLCSMDGYGTDALIYLKVLSHEANECIPVFNKTAVKVYGSDVSVSDWSSPAPWSQNSSRTFSTFAPRTLQFTPQTFQLRNTHSKIS